MIKRMDLAWVLVKNITKATDFFTQTLGLKITSGDAKYKRVELSGIDGGASLGVAECTTPSPVTPGQNEVLTMTVDDLDVLRKQLEAKDVSFIGEVIEVPGHVKMIFFKDLDGNIFQLVQMLG